MTNYGQILTLLHWKSQTQKINIFYSLNISIVMNDLAN